jgi:hypothetical protein
MPRVPLLSHGIKLPDSASIIPSVVMIAGLWLLVVAPLKFRQLWWLVAASLFISFLVDQHRLQPWAYQSAIYAVVFASMDRSQARRWLIPLAASVYLYSAAGKFDFQFTHTVGQDFLDAVFRPFGGLPDSLDPSARTRLALIFPAIEFLAGLGLLFRPTRPFAAVAVMLMHTSLIVMLGPWALDQSTGVLVWNLLLLIQAYLLMLRSERDDENRVESPPPHRAGISTRLTQIFVLMALIAPLFERSGYWDHWTSWSLYSPHTSRVDIELHRSAIASLDPYVQSFLDADSNQDGWQQLSLQRWSLGDRAVPIYPQARYQLALAAELAARHQLNDEIRVRVRGCANRWTGRRQERLLLGRREIQDGLKAFWLSR